MLSQAPKKPEDPVHQYYPIGFVSPAIQNQIIELWSVFKVVRAANSGLSDDRHFLQLW